MDIVKKLRELYKQAITEKSHYYVAECCKEAIESLKNLRCCGNCKHIDIENFRVCLHKMNNCMSCSPYCLCELWEYDELDEEGRLI